MNISTKTRVTMLLLTVAALAGAAASAEAAGCLREFDDCGDCARSKFLNGFMDGDIGEMIDAYVDGLDCEIDLAHCLLYAHHHDYSNCSA